MLGYTLSNQFKGNIESNGPIDSTSIKMYDKLVQLSGPYSVIGRAFVVHAGLLQKLTVHFEP